MRVNSVLPLLVLAVAGSVRTVPAQSPGTFTGTGSLTRPRQFHTATLLNNRKVLIAGGNAIFQAPFASAELYDPFTGTFTATGDMTTPRYMHSATMLPNGKVLLAGGRSDSAGYPSGLYSAELYDPAAGTFTGAGDMTTARMLHTATLLNNGKVLLAGGGHGDTVHSAELYDPTTGTFTPTGDMTEPGAETANLLPNGKVLITRSVLPGQQRGNDQIFKPNHAELYDPATGTFTRTGDMIDQNIGERPTATLLTSGKVLIAGGSLGDLGGSTSAEIYDPATGSFRATGKMTSGIDVWQAAALVPNGSVLIAGRGSRGTISGPGTAELYDSPSGSFSALSNSMSSDGHAVILLPDGTLLLSGGWICCGATIATAEVYRPAVLLPSPVLFSLAGSVQGAILHADTHQVVSSDNPTVAGEVLEIYGTGLIEGSAIPPLVAIGGRIAEVLFFGKAPGFAGLNQVNVRIPSGVAAGLAVSVRLTYLNRPSNEVTIAVR